MPFVSSRRLEDLLNPAAGRVAAKAMTEKGGSRLAEAVRIRTPVDVSYSPLPRAGGRSRGTARESIEEGGVRAHTSARGRGYAKKVFTEDPVFPYIEWNTRPHIIRPTPEHVARAAALGHRAALRFFASGQVVFAGQVLHPGTTGQHPFARAAAFVQAEVGEAMFREELEEFARNLVPTRTGRIIDRTGRPAVAKVMDASIASWIRAHTIQIPRSGRRAVNDLLGWE